MKALICDRCGEPIAVDDVYFLVERRYRGRVQFPRYHFCSTCYLRLSTPVKEESNV